MAALQQTFVVSEKLIQPSICGEDDKFIATVAVQAVRHPHALLECIGNALENCIVDLFEVIKI